MQSSRRIFLKNSSLAIAGAALLPGCATGLDNQTDELTGLQLYSVREDMRTDPLGTLKQLAEMGYRYVEHAGYNDRKFYGYSAVDFKKVLSDLGMSMPSGHNVLNKNHWDDNSKDFTDEWKNTVEDVATAGGQYIISPWLDQSLREDIDVFKSFMDIFNKCGELCKKSGLTFGYHNHHFEFNTSLDGKILYDQILQNTDEELVTQQLDIGNMYNGGAKALDVIRQYPGRFASMHVKDEIKSENEGEEEYESTILGTGVIGVKEVIDEGRKTGGTKHFIIEQEAYQGKTPISCMKEDIDHMVKWGY